MGILGSLEYFEGEKRNVDINERLGFNCLCLGAKRARLGAKNWGHFVWGQKERQGPKKGIFCVK